MKQQSMLLLVMVGMSLGALADCYSEPCSCCHGYGSDGFLQLRSIDNYCSVNELKNACEEVGNSGSTSAVALVPCDPGYRSYVTYDLCWGGAEFGNCHRCMESES